MSRFTQFLSNASHRVPVTSHVFCFDLGSQNLRMLLDHHIFVNEPSSIALHTSSKSVVSVGQEAAQLFGKNPASIQVIYPIRRAKVVDVFALQELLRATIEKYAPQSQSFPALLNRQARIAISPSLPGMHKEVIQNFLSAQGFRKIQFIHKTDAIVHHLKKRHAVPILFLVDIGAMTTEVALFSQGEVVFQKTLPIGGEDFTAVVVHAVRKVHQCEIGWQTAEKIKKELGSVLVKSEKRLTVVRGRDVITNLPKTIQVTNADMVEGFAHLAQDIIQGVREVCEEVSPELLTLALQQGIFLTGGGGLLRGMDHFFQDQLQVSIILSGTPFEDVVRGLSE